MIDLCLKVYKEEIDELRFKYRLGLNVNNHCIDYNLVLEYMNSVGFVIRSQDRYIVTWDDYDKV